MTAACRLLGAAVIAWLALTGAATAQITVARDADPDTLGTIPEGVYMGTCGVKQVAFYISGIDNIRSVAVTMKIAQTSFGSTAASLISPSGRSFFLYPLMGSVIQSVLVGTYTFSDAATDNLRTAAIAAGNNRVLDGSYRTVGPDNASSFLSEAFLDEPPAGIWYLRFANCSPAPQGTISSATLTIAGNAVATANANADTLGGIPDSPGGPPRTPGAPLDVTFVVPPGRGPVLTVRLSMTVTHPYVGDLVARLIAPSGQSHVLFGYTGNSVSSPIFASTVGLSGTYTFLDGYRGRPFWANVVYGGANPLPGGLYNTSELGGPKATGEDTLMDPVFAGVPSAGVWTLRLTDGYAGGIGIISAARLTLETAATPTAVADAYSTTYPAPLTVPFPGVLGNDYSNLGTGLTAQLVSPPSHGTLTLDRYGEFTYVPAPAFAGVDTFIYRAVSAQGPGTTASVTLTVNPPTTLQPPVALTASNISGNDVTLRWLVPPGPAPADYVIEGGVVPGQTLGAFAVGGPLPILTFTAPSGVFFVRVHAVANGLRSGPSNEIRIVVNTPEPPSAPSGLAGLVQGNQLGLSWKNTFGGGAPAGQLLTVTGAATAAIPLALGESFSYAGVPPGTYTFRMRAVNASGAGAESNPVTLTFPGGCSGAPLAPVNFLAYAVGNQVRVVWDPPAAGPAATGYLLQVSGSYTGSLPVPTRGFATAAPSGAYTIAVVAVNACGSSTPTAAQTVFVP